MLIKLQKYQKLHHSPQNNLETNEEEMVRSSIIESSLIVIRCIWIFVGNITAFYLDITQAQEIFDTLFLTFSAFLFVYCFIWVEGLQLESINCCYSGSWKITCTKLFFKFFPKLQRKYKQNINKIEYTIMLQYWRFSGRK